MTPRRNTDTFDRRTFLAGLTMMGGVARLSADGQAANDLEALAHLVRVTTETTAAQYRRILVAAAGREGIPINADQMAVASKDKALVMAAPAVDVERIDPVALRHGITQGVMFLESSSPEALRGFFVVRAIVATEVVLGEQPVLLQMIRGGTVVAAERGVARVWSLTVPPGAAAVRAEAGVGLDLVMNDVLVRSNCWTCPNGVTICVERPICGPDGLLPSGSCG
jgi:hypothetical protein